MVERHYSKTLQLYLLFINWPADPSTDCHFVVVSFFNVLIIKSHPASPGRVFQVKEGHWQSAGTRALSCVNDPDYEYEFVDRGIVKEDSVGIHLKLGELSAGEMVGRRRANAEMRSS